MRSKYFRNSPSLTFFALPRARVVSVLFLRMGSSSVALFLSRHSSSEKISIDPGGPYSSAFQIPQARRLRVRIYRTRRSFCKALRLIPADARFSKSLPFLSDFLPSAFLHPRLIQTSTRCPPSVQKGRLPGRTVCDRRDALSSLSPSFLRSFDCHGTAERVFPRFFPQIPLRFFTAPLRKEVSVLAPIAVDSPIPQSLTLVAPRLRGVFELSHRRPVRQFPFLRGSLLSIKFLPPHIAASLFFPFPQNLDPTPPYGCTDPVGHRRFPILPPLWLRGVRRLCV